MLQPRNIVFLFLVVIPLIYFSTTQSLYYLWFESGNPAYSHGAIAALIAIYIFLKYWFDDKAAPKSPRFHILGTIVLLLCSVLWFLAALGGIQILQQLLLVGLVAALFWSLFGIATLQSLAIPLLVVLTAIPVWDFLNHPLQMATAINVEAMLKVTGIPFVREGTDILLPNGTFRIEERCSGLRMFVAMVAIALLCIYQWRLRFGVSVIFMLVSLVLAIIINSIRIYIVVIAGYMTDMQHYFVTTDHVTLGWVLFGIVLFAYLMLCNKYLLSDRWYARVARQTSTGDKHRDDGGISSDSKKTSAQLLAIVATVVGVALGPVLTAVYENHPEGELDVAINPGTIKNWTMNEGIKADWQANYQNADYQQQVIYENGTGHRVEFYYAYYAFQSQGKEAIHYLNRMYDEKDWKLVSQRKLIQPLGDASLPVNQRIIESTRGKKKLLWQWYYLNNRRLSGGIETKLAGIRSILSGDPAITVIIAAADMNPSYEETQTVLVSFLTESIGAIETAIDQSRHSTK